ncbi:MAG: sigma-70 family RNA polymerase sigma factor [Vampirovibrionales bacterium]|nr:sigma-70 family RNA polymerase sigma factor [Vampirovibrionales bacterium]
MTQPPHSFSAPKSGKPAGNLSAGGNAVDAGKTGEAKPANSKPTTLQYIPLVERVAKAEFQRIPNHLVDYDELVTIGAMAIQALLKGKSAADAERLNTSYVATAIRWAIRNELRTRYKWYTLKTTSAASEDTTATEGEPSAEGSEDGDDVPSAGPQVREAVYQSILSIDGIADSGDGDNSYDFIADQSATPDERLEITELGKAIRAAIETLPEKERYIMECRFYRNMQVKDIAHSVNLSSSRITRIVQSCLDLVRDYLKENDHID